MLSLLKNIFKDKNLKLPNEKVKEIIDDAGAEPWFYYAFAERSKRPHIWKPSFWIVENIYREARIFETGCGCALNLIWFAQNGFVNLLGSDISEKAIAAGMELAKLAKFDINLWVDDSINPTKLPAKIDVLLALNWTYHVQNFNLDKFLANYLNCISDNGILVMDTIDSSYNQVKNNQYCTTDWNKEIADRRDTEYKVRYSREVVEKSCKLVGFQIIDLIDIKGIVPKKIYFLKKI